MMIGNGNGYDLLIDDVEGEDADAVELLLSCSCAHRMKGAAEWKMFVFAITPLHIVSLSLFLSLSSHHRQTHHPPGDCRKDGAERVWQVQPILLILRQVFKHTAPVPARRRI